MLDVIEKLLILQDRDRKIIRTKAELAHIDPERKSIQARLAKAQEAAENSKTRSKQVESERKQLELEAETLKQKIDKYSNQQLQTKKNEEFQAMSREIQNCKKQIFDLENRQIDLMEQAEAAQKIVVDATKIYNDDKKAIESQMTQLAAREINLKKELETLQGNRGELSSVVDPTALGRYDRLLKNKGENVIVGIEHGVCGGCHMKFPLQVIVACKKHDEIVTCPNCARILYYTKDMDLAVVD